MIFLYDEAAGAQVLELRGEAHKYLVKVRRHHVGDCIDFRKKTLPEYLYHYRITSIEPRKLSLNLESSEVKNVVPQYSFHLGWCVIDPKSVEKVLPALNEMGVEKISFIYCDRSQKNFKIDIKRYERIVEASNQQCGRSSVMEFTFYKNIKAFLETYPEAKVLDFCDNILEDGVQFSSVLVGCEGGFSPAEKELLEKQQRFRFSTPLVLRSESAAVAIAAKNLL